MNPSPTDEQDNQDMQQLAAGHDAALNNLMERHGERLFHYLIRQLQNEADAADLSQETFVRVYQNRTKFKPGAKFSTWLYTIATNLVRDRFRFRSRHPQVSLDAENEAGKSFAENQAEQRPNPSETLQAEERTESIRRAVAELPEDLRTPLLLAEYEEKSQAEIAEIMNCSIKAVETRIYRARQHLRKQLEKILQPA